MRERDLLSIAPLGGWFYLKDLPVVEHIHWYGNVEVIAGALARKGMLEVSSETYPNGSTGLKYKVATRPEVILSERIDNLLKSLNQLERRVHELEEAACSPS
jgi:hypothetical protein